MNVQESIFQLRTQDQSDCIKYLFFREQVTFSSTSQSVELSVFQMSAVVVEASKIDPQQDWSQPESINCSNPRDAIVKKIGQVLLSTECKNIILLSLLIKSNKES
eukprot:TRINITY_DN26891_c0_g1_i1.p1 TRINITY_DN26891_c0_g1~~TRINITY_DN26891_c0_g1_i1.p1  ORF type:complete len:105 (+),score=8.67 TRINITY_DN26891_c0_g1_i1:3-317(+)